MKSKKSEPLTASRNFYLYLRWVAYLLFFACSISIIVSCQNNNALFNIGCSMLASVCVATLIDIADIIKRKQLSRQQQDFLLVEYKKSVDNLIWDIIEQARYTKTVNIKSGTEYQFSEWLDVLLRRESYLLTDDPSKLDADFEFVFEWINSFIRRVEEAANYLTSQQTILLVSDLLESKDITYFRSQSNLCRRIQQYCKKRDIVRVKRGVLNLLNDYSKKFAEDILNKPYSLDVDIVPCSHANESDEEAR